MPPATFIPANKLTPGYYYATMCRNRREYIIRIADEAPFLEITCPGLPLAKVGDFEQFQRVPTREQWSEAVELRDSIREGHGELAVA